MDYGQHCDNKFNKTVELYAWSTETVVLEIQQVDNRLKATKNMGEELFDIKGNGPPPGQARFTFTVFDGVKQGSNVLTYIPMQGYNEPKQSEHNEWKFKWALSRRNERGVEVWSDHFSINCPNDQSGGWDRSVFTWVLLIRWIKSPLIELTSEEADQHSRAFKR